MFVAKVVTTQAVGASTPARTENRRRRYQRSLSKVTTNVRRYIESGAIHRNGLTATSWVSSLVVAISKTDPVAASASQKRIVQGVGLASASSPTVGASGPERRRVNDTYIPSTANTQ